jgi:hypothetical protein
MNHLLHILGSVLTVLSPLRKYPSTSYMDFKIYIITPDVDFEIHIASRWVLS